jgi:plastocyanin
MKKIIHLSLLFFAVISFQACTKTESDFTPVVPESIIVSSNTINVTAGESVSFTVNSSVNNEIVTTQSTIFVNGTLITGNRFTFNSAGTFAVFAKKGTLTSNILTITVSEIIQNTASYKHNVLVEEYSGTWCGNCPRILYGVDLLEQQTDKAIVVSTHLFNGDPFITAEGNNLAAQQGVGGVPTGFINRTTGWNGPQYENVNQVINTIQASAKTGLAISSSETGGNISVNVKIGYAEPLAGAAKLTVYLVEDKLYFTQRNYSSNLYNGQSSIANFEYNGVIRKIVSPLTGDAISNTGTTNEKNYSLALPSNITNTANARIVAFVTNSAGTVVNVQQAKLGQTKAFETL